MRLYIEHLTSRGVGAVHLAIYPDNQSARTLYEKCGFRVVPRIMMTKEIVKCEQP
ncbi:MAG: GNAT family N-acetyltransferase [Firmicutes bacterium]|nr:GNAT family N-acetyltransferase [Bacillota bacterium]